MSDPAGTTGAGLVRVPDEAALAEAAGALGAGEAVGVPTDTVYGLAALAGSPAGCARLFALKRRPEVVALPVLVGDPTAAFDLAEDRARPALAALAAAFWPGPLTVVVPAASPRAHLGGDGGAVGLRCPDDPVVAALCRRAGALAVTSANLHGEPPCTAAGDVAAAFPVGLRCVLDGGRRAGLPSSVVSIVAGDPVLLRPGPVDGDAVSEVLAPIRHREVPK